MYLIKVYISCITYFKLPVSVVCPPRTSCKLWWRPAKHSRSSPPRWRLCGTAARVPSTRWKTDRNSWGWETRLELVTLNVEFRPLIFCQVIKSTVLSGLDGFDICFCFISTGSVLFFIAGVSVLILKHPGVVLPLPSPCSHFWDVTCVR